MKIGITLKDKKLTASLEDYLEATYQIIQEKQGVKAIEISRRLGVGRSSVTEALKNLAVKKLVNYGRYDAISLTPEGEAMAMKIVMKHKTLYAFLVKILGVNKKDAQENACKMEHVVSEDVLKRLTLFVEFNKNFYCNKHNYIEEFKKFYEQESKK